MPSEISTPIYKPILSYPLDENTDYNSLVVGLREQSVGNSERVSVPFDGTTRKLIYCDFTASGRSVTAIEDFLTTTVCSTYANTHSLASATARQTMQYREEARDKVREYFNCSSEDSVIFCGAGATAAITKFTDIMCRSRVFATEHSPKGLRRAVLIIDPVAHHSSVLPFRELALRYPLSRVTRSRSVPNSFVKRFGGDKSSDIEIELVTLPLDPLKGTASVEGLESVLEKVAHFNRRSPGFAVPVVVLSACSNVTGACLNMPEVSTLIHKYNGVAAWDLAAIAAHKKVDMNPLSHPYGYIDFAFVSPHKLLGGPGSSGLLLCKSKHQTNAVPGVCGGGVVLYVSRRGHHYIDNLEEREEAGTPDILGCIRTGAVYHLHTLIGIDKIAQEEQYMADYLSTRIKKNDKDRSHCAGIISFNILYNKTTTNHGLYLHYNFVGALLNDLFGIQARGGCACAGPYGEAILGLNCGSAERFEDALDSTRYEIFKPGFVRVGVHFTMTQEELDFVAEAILWIAENGWKLLPCYSFKVMTGEWFHLHRDEHHTLRKLTDELSPATFLPKTDDMSVGNASTRYSSSPGRRRRSSNFSSGSHGISVDDNLHSAIDKADELLEKILKEIDSIEIVVPLLDPEVADLLWFAHPLDAKLSLMHPKDNIIFPTVKTGLNNPEVFHLEGFNYNNLRIRPDESIFNVLCWSDSIDPPKGAKEAARNRKSITKMMMKMMWLKVTCRERPLGPRERHPVMFAKYHTRARLSAL
ncbi:hypothetical protein FOL47_008756 [Perkinsus chesapeaki]|uniref:Aminotransferase class V domain-containing protein n=1 Tax=Perkinsus chesapeaki TaxID=330153 RepID=A0A7J6LC13_PERCH|nr:hypothetical protein FOL47_008756 [Perkinsus chesapeaki]